MARNAPKDLRTGNAMIHPGQPGKTRNTRKERSKQNENEKSLFPDGAYDACDAVC